MNVSKTHVELAQRHKIVLVTMPVSNSADFEYMSMTCVWEPVDCSNLAVFFTV